MKTKTKGKSGKGGKGAKHEKEEDKKPEPTAEEIAKMEEEERQQDKFFYVFPGNYPNCVKTALWKRGNWIEVLPSLLMNSGKSRRML